MFSNIWHRGTRKVQNEIETKRNETKSNKTKRNRTKRNQKKCNEKKSKIQYGMKTKRVYNILIIQI